MKIKSVWFVVGFGFIAGAIGLFYGQIVPLLMDFVAAIGAGIYSLFQMHWRFHLEKKALREDSRPVRFDPQVALWIIILLFLGAGGVAHNLTPIKIAAITVVLWVVTKVYLAFLDKRKVHEENSLRRQHATQGTMGGGPNSNDYNQMLVAHSGHHKQKETNG